MDNKTFNVKGRTKEQLLLTLNCLLLDEYGKIITLDGYYIDKEKGFVLVKYKQNDDVTLFTDRLGKALPIDYINLTDILWEWLQSNEAKTIILKDSDEDLDHDGSNSLGWRLYNEECGSVYKDKSLNHSTIAAFTPSYCWYGK